MESPPPPALDGGDSAVNYLAWGRTSAALGLLVPGGGEHTERQHRDYNRVENTENVNTGITTEHTERQHDYITAGSRKRGLKERTFGTIIYKIFYTLIIND